MARYSSRSLSLELANPWTPVDMLPDHESPFMRDPLEVAEPCYGAGGVRQ